MKQIRRLLFRNFYPLQKGVNPPDFFVPRRALGVKVFHLLFAMLTLPKTVVAPELFKVGVENIIVLKKQAKWLVFH